MTSHYTLKHKMQHESQINYICNEETAGLMATKTLRPLETAEGCSHNADSMCVNEYCLARK